MSARIKYSDVLETFKRAQAFDWDIEEDLDKTSVNPCKLTLVFVLV